MFFVRLWATDGDEGRESETPGNVEWKGQTETKNQVEIVGRITYGDIEDPGLDSLPRRPVHESLPRTPRTGLERTGE